MTRREALELYNLEVETLTDVSINSKFRELMFSNHPDRSDGTLVSVGDIKTARDVLLAFLDELKSE